MSATIKKSKVSQEVISILSDINVDNLTPLNAFDIILQLTDKLKKE